MPEAPVARLAAAIESLVRAHKAATPPPRGLPYLGLEPASGTGFHLLDALAARGIFRKYECVLDLGAGLGGTSRWLAARLGCEVVGTTGSRAEAEAGAALTRRAGLSAQVRLVPAEGAALPFRSAHFTHVWILEALPRLGDPLAALAEAYRVLRRGGTLAIQDLVRPGAGSAPAIPGWTPSIAAERVETLERLGFVELELRDRSADAAERSAQVLAARDRLEARLRRDPRSAAFARERASLADALATGALRVIQIVARRP
jgi:SAM-dependent methyltransferase